jgi:hypothetical protein
MESLAAVLQDQHFGSIVDAWNGGAEAGILGPKAVVTAVAYDHGTISFMPAVEIDVGSSSCPSAKPGVW